MSEDEIFGWGDKNKQVVEPQPVEQSNRRGLLNRIGAAEPVQEETYTAYTDRMSKGLLNPQKGVASGATPGVRNGR
jgi:hypothetical protein